MFRCAVTGLVSQPREKMLRMVTGTRPMVYQNLVYDRETDTEVIKTSQGHETVSEICVTQAGYDRLMKGDGRV